jgi:hypothetical protein
MTEAETAQAKRAEAIEAAAYRELVAAAPPEFARATGLRSAEIAGVTLLIAPGFPDTLFNRAIGLGVHRPAAEADLDAVIGAFREAGCKNYWIHLAPCAAPQSLPRWLEARGFAPPPRRTWAKMVRGVGRPPEFGGALEVGAASPEEESAAAEAIRGAHRALMALRIGEAGAAGCTEIHTETGEPVTNEPNPSLANMQRCGFTRIYSRLNYAPPG